MLVVTRERPLPPEPIEPHLIVADTLFEHSNATAAPFIHTNGNDIYFVESDRITKKTRQGEEVWQTPLREMTEDMIVVPNGEFIGIRESGSNTFYVIDGQGEIQRTQLVHPILALAINEKGYAAIYVQGEEGYKIYVVDQMGELIFDTFLTDGHILPMILSFSGNIVALSVGDISLLEVQTSVMFIDIEQGLIGHTPWLSDIVYNMTFYSGDLFVTHNDGIKVVDVNSLEVIWQREQNVDNVFFTEGFVVLQDGDRLNTITKQNEDIGSYTIDAGTVTYLNVSHGYIIIGINREFYALNSEGDRVWSFVTVGQPIELSMLEDTSYAILKTEVEVSLLKRIG